MRAKGLEDSAAGCPSKSRCPPSSPLMCQGCPSRCPSGCNSHRSCAMDALHVVLHDAPIITAHVPRMPFKIPFWVPLASLMCNGCPSCCSYAPMCQGCPSRCPSGCHLHRSCAMAALHAVLHDAPIITAHVPRMPFKVPFWMPLASVMCNGHLLKGDHGRASHAKYGHQIRALIKGRPRPSQPRQTRPPNTGIY